MTITDRSSGRSARADRPTWLVDGLNVIGSRPDGWWRDRRAAMRRLVAALTAFAASRDEAVIAVFDGSPFELDLECVRGAPEVVFAAGPGAGAADEAIVVIVRDHPRPASVRVVTSDRELSARSRRLGAEIVTAGSFRRLLDEAAGGGESSEGG